ncbi:MAG: hypothetical protein ACKVWV_12895 [Planctomycetota bacterium]
MHASFQSSFRSFALTIAGASLASPVLAGVIVVDVAGGGSFTQIQPAVDAAANGDTLLVKNGNYAGFVIDDKALNVVRDAGTTGAITNTITVRNLAVDKDVLLQNLVVTAPSVEDAITHGLVCTNNAGSVRVQDSTLTGGNADFDGCGDFQFPGAGASVQSSTDVVMIRCTLTGGLGWGFANCNCGFARQGGAGLQSSASLVALYDCALLGGRGGPGMECGGKGGTGALVSGSLGVYAADSSFTGGMGGMFGLPDATCPSWSGGYGGSGLVVQSPAVAQSLDNTFAAGTQIGSSQIFCPQDDWSQGVPTQGSLFQFIGAGRSIEFPSPVREGQALHVTIRGVAGDRVRLRLSSDTSFQTIPSLRGVLNTPHLDQGLIVGALPASGTLVVSVPNPMLPSGTLAQQKYLQASVVTPAGGYIGSMGTLVVLDAGF